MLASFLNSNQSLFNNLAKTWLEQNKANISIWSEDRQLASWSSTTDASEPSVHAKIHLWGKEIGEIRYAGDACDSVRARLQMDAAFISTLITRENDLSAMASEVISTRDQLVALYNVAKNTAPLIDLVQTLDRLAYETAQLTRADSAFIGIRFAGELMRFSFAPQQKLDPEKLETMIEQQLLVGEKGYFFAEHCDCCYEKDFNLLVLPVEVRSVQVAAIGVQTRTNSASLSPLIKLVQTIGQYAGAHIENLLLARESVELAKLHTEMELAKKVQLSILPLKTPAIAGLDIWAGSRPASVVGGDFYDFIERPNRPLTFTVGDISGKGLPASLPMAMVRTLIRAQVNGYPLPTPEMILCASNAELYEDFDQLAMFATTFVGQYNPQRNELLYASAGHSPVIYCPANRKAFHLEADGIPLGLLPASFYNNQLLHLAVSDVLIIGTDGLYEAHDQNDQPFGLDRLIELVSMRSSCSAREIAESIFESVAAFRGTEAQEDDQTLIVIKRTY